MSWWIGKPDVQPEREPRTIKILCESEHYVVLGPPRGITHYSECLDELEFFVSQGYRPLFIMPGMGEIVCERTVQYGDAVGVAHTIRITDLPRGPVP